MNVAEVAYKVVVPANSDGTQWLESPKKNLWQLTPEEIHDICMRTRADEPAVAQRVIEHVSVNCITSN